MIVMELGFLEYMKHIDEMLKEEIISEKLDNLKPLGKFTMSAENVWEPVHYAGYTLITPTYANDSDNSDSYDALIGVKKKLSGYLNPSKCVEAPDAALHMTIARLVSGETFESRIRGCSEKDFLNCLGELSLKHATFGKLIFEIRGISVFPQGVIAAMVSSIHEDDYSNLQKIRDFIYSDEGIKGFNVEWKRGFNGHISLFYVEREFNRLEKQMLLNILSDINKEFFAKPLPFCISRAEARRFENFLSFDREENWPVFRFL